MKVRVRSLEGGWLVAARAGGKTLSPSSGTDGQSLDTPRLCKQVEFQRNEEDQADNRVVSSNEFRNGSK